MKAVILAAATLGLMAPGLALAATPPAKAPVSASAKPELQLAAKLLDFIEYRNAVRRGMEGSTLPAELVAVRPDWTPMFKTAMDEELDRDMPVIESMLASGLRKTFSDDEMKAGLQIVSDKSLKAIYMAAQNGAPEPAVEVSKTTEDLLATPAGQSFAAKLQTINTVLDPVQIEVMATVMPGVMRRFGEKAEAAEVAKRAAAGYAAAR
jgi:cytochrome c5